MEAAAVWIGSLINMAIPALIFLFLNDRIFLSKYSKRTDPKSKKVYHRKLLRLIPYSPLGLLVTLAIVLFIFETVLSSFLIALGVTDFHDDNTIVPEFSPVYGILIDTDLLGTSNFTMLIMLIMIFLISIPVLLFVIRSYCKLVGCSHELGVFVYMAVLYMYVTSVLITLPLGEDHPTFSSLLSTGSFIVMLLIFYIPSADKIEFMRKNEHSGLLAQINTLPIINFILLVILLGFEAMLDSCGYLDIGYYFIILAFAIILYAASQMAYNILFRHIEERTEIEILSKQSLETQEQVTLAFAEITEAKSGQTGKHVKRVSEYSRAIAQAMGLDHDQVENIRIGSMMHDIGKLLIPPEILEKGGSLTDEEFAVIKTHVNIGENLLHNAPGEIMAVARVIAQQHHEWWNGKGYLGMKGEEIDLSARITAVADVYDALTSNRSYKKAWKGEEAFRIIKEESGEHFDPQVVKVFEENFDKIKEIQAQYKD